MLEAGTLSKSRGVIRHVSGTGHPTISTTGDGLPQSSQAQETPREKESCGAWFWPPTHLFVAFFAFSIFIFIFTFTFLYIFHTLCLLKRQMKGRRAEACGLANYKSTTTTITTNEVPTFLPNSDYPSLSFFYTLLPVDAHYTVAEMLLPSFVYMLRG